MEPTRFFIHLMTFVFLLLFEKNYTMRQYSIQHRRGLCIPALLVSIVDLMIKAVRRYI